MGSEPFTQDWELIVSPDLAPTLIPPGQLRRLQRPVDVRMLPAGASAALGHDVGGHGLQDLLLVPAVVRPAGPGWRRRCQYAPMCVLAIGERGLGLWVQAPPSPRVQMTLPFADITAIERRTDGSWRSLTVTGPDARFRVWYDADGDASADIWIRRLRRRVAVWAGPLPAGSRGNRRPRTVRPFLIHPDDDVVVNGRPLVAGSGRLAVTAREIIVVHSRRPLTRPWRRSARALYVPRASIAGHTAADPGLAVEGGAKGG